MNKVDKKAVFLLFCCTMLSTSLSNPKYQSKSHCKSITQRVDRLKAMGKTACRIKPGEKETEKPKEPEEPGESEKTENVDNSPDRNCSGVGAGLVAGLVAIILLVGIVFFLLGFKFGMIKERKKSPPPDQNNAMAELSPTYEDIFEREEGASADPHYNHLDPLQEDEDGRYMSPKAPPKRPPPPGENLNIGIYDDGIGYMYPEAASVRRPQNDKDANIGGNEEEYVYADNPQGLPSDQNDNTDFYSKEKPCENRPDPDYAYSKAAVVCDDVGGEYSK